MQDQVARASVGAWQVACPAAAPSRLHQQRATSGLPRGRLYEMVCSLGLNVGVTALAASSSTSSSHPQPQTLTHRDDNPSVTRPEPPSSPTPRSLTLSRPPTTSRAPSTREWRVRFSPTSHPPSSLFFTSSLHPSALSPLLPYTLSLLLCLVRPLTYSVASAVQPQQEKSTTQKVGDALTGDNKNKDIA